MRLIGWRFWLDPTRVRLKRRNSDAVEILFFSTREQAEGFVHLIPWMQQRPSMTDQSTGLSIEFAEPGGIPWGEIESALIIPTGLAKDL